MKWTDPCRAPSIGRLRAAPLGDLDQKVIRAYVQGILSRILRRTGQGNSLSFAVQPMGSLMGRPTWSADYDLAHSAVTPTPVRTIEDFSVSFWLPSSSPAVTCRNTTSFTELRSLRRYG